MVRWDSPLVTIPWDEEPPFDAIWEIVTKGEKKGPTAAVAQVRPSSPLLPVPIDVDHHSRCAELGLQRSWNH